MSTVFHTLLKSYNLKFFNPLTPVQSKHSMQSKDRPIYGFTDVTDIILWYWPIADILISAYVFSEMRRC